GLHVGLNLPLAIALHNIPKTKTILGRIPILKTLVSRLAEPLGVIIVAYLFPSSLDPEILRGLLGARNTFFTLFPLDVQAKHYVSN
nr:zinc transporter ZTP29 [Tanacetum cinerariifolium]